MPAKLCRLTLPVAIALTPIMATAQPNLPVSGAIKESQLQAPRHAAWDRLLKKYVRAGDDGVNRVDYAALKANAADLAALDTYIAGFAGMDLSGTGPAEFAAWANLYNAVTIRYVVEKYPIGSIRDGYLIGGPWKKVTAQAGGRTVSLDEIEHKILRRNFHDPRVHYSVNCASYSCPNLPVRAWEAETLDEDLDAAASAYINHRRGVTVTGRGLVLSSIYNWFEADFGGSKEAVLDHLLQYADAGLAAAIRANPGIRKYDYDWSLNDTQQAGLK